MTAPRGYQVATTDALCLNFANTLAWRGRSQPAEALQTPDDLLAWTDQEAGADPDLVRVCRESWPPEQGLQTAIAIRETICRLFAATAACGGMPQADHVAELNQWMAAAPGRKQLTDDGRRWRFEASPSVLALLAPVLWSAGDLLTTMRLSRVRACANPECRWLFLDDSKAGTRRWCSMSACGNRAKAHRHSQRRKARP
ncbi:MAG: ABATE domain-containing protein [Acetobacteraceae bacterium]|nr:ABATE domain-containing protein [Acetobacteraceae bacterium]